MANAPLNPLRTFSVASRHATFTEAARELGVTQVAVSRQVAVLEDHFDTQLFDRDANALKLTEAGVELSLQIAPLFQDIERIANEFLEKERRQTVNIRAYPTFTHYWLLPRLTSVLGDQAEFDFRIDTKVEPLDFRKGYLDVAIQLGDGKWTNARSRFLFDEEIDVVCAPSYRDAFIQDPSNPDLSNLTLLHAKYRRREWADWADANDLPLDGLRSLEFQSSILSYQAAKSGLGMAIGQIKLLEQELADGTLVRPFDNALATGSAFWVSWPTLTSVTSATKHFVDWLLVSSGQAPEFRRKAGGKFEAASADTL